MSLINKILSFFKNKEDSNHDTKMNVGTKDDENLSIEFPELETVTENGEVSFAVDVNGNRKKCIITREVLHDFFGLRDSNPLEPFRQNRSQIQHVAERIIGENPNQESFILNTTNFSKN